jgi:hypothetical protein
MDEPLRERIQRHRLRAAEVRQLADSVLDLECRHALEALARGYDEIANRLEGAETSRRA